MTEQQYKTDKEKARFYKSKDWQLLRRVILERDNYECTECKRLGLVKVASENKLDVDHIQSVEHNPELALDPDNLQVLCVRHHNEKEGRGIKGKPNKWKHDERW